MRGGRIKYAIEQLIAHRADLTIASFGLTQTQLDALAHVAPQDQTHLADWLTRLEQLGVFFSWPLDLDFLLLEAFPNQYQAATTGTGPQISTDLAGRAARLESARKAVLKPEGGDGATYTAAQKELFIWYQYLFLGRGKPVTHMTALANINDATLAAAMPAVLRRLLARCMQLSGISPQGGGAA